VSRWLGRVPLELLAEAMQRTPQELHSEMVQAGLAPAFRRRQSAVWTRAEDELLLERYATSHVRVLAHDLGRSPGAVSGRAHALGLRLDRRLRGRRHSALIEKSFFRK